MAKQFAIDVDFRVTKRIYVDAENAEQAEQKVEERCKANPCQYTSDIDACTDYSIIEVNECEDDNADTAEPSQDVYNSYSDNMKQAVKYVNEQLEPEDIAIICATVDKNFNRHLNPSYGMDEGKIIDLLEEYGQDNDLPEGWWMEECDIDDIVLLIQFEN